MTKQMKANMIHGWQTWNKRSFLSPVHENYCGDTGDRCHVNNSDRFYHWGRLLSILSLMEDQGDF